jgi:hypothetical protein
MKLSVKCRILFFLLVAIIVSCDINIPEDWEYGDTVLRGIVVDKADSTPLDSVLFTLAYSKIMQNTLYQELTPKTDSTGTFRFDIYCDAGVCLSFRIEKRRIFTRTGSYISFFN